MSSRQLQWGAMGFGPASGMTSSFECWSLPFDMDETDRVSVTLEALTETPVAMLLVGSATAGDGILYVAQTAGTGGNAISVTHSSPSGTPLPLLVGAVGTGPGTFSGLMNPAPIAGTIQVLDNGTVIGYDDGQGGFKNVAAGAEITGGSVNYTAGAYTLTTTAAGGHAITLKWVPSGAVVTNPYSLSTDAITCAPWVGATNGQMAMLANQKSSIAALVKAYPYGWGPVGLPFNSLNSLIQQAALSDLLVAQSSANLAGGASTAAISGIATLECSDDLVGWQAYNGGPNDVASGNLNTGSVDLHVDVVPVRYGRIHWLPNSGGSVGQISGMITLKGIAR